LVGKIYTREDLILFHSSTMEPKKGRIMALAIMAMKLMTEKEVEKFLLFPTIFQEF